MTEITSDSVAVNVLDDDSRLDSMNVRHPISGILGRCRSGNLVAADSYRTYVSTVNASTKLDVVREFDEKRVLYQIGVVSDSALHRFYYPKEDKAETLIRQDVRVTAEISDELIGLHKKYSNFSGYFRYMDMSGMAYYLGVALAHYSVGGWIDCKTIRSGMPVNIRGLGVRDDPVSSGEGCVFIPRHAALDDCPGAFYALAAVANRTGASVYTDVLAVNNANQVVMHEPCDLELAMGCVHGIRILLNMYDFMVSGSTIAYAFFRGLNQVLSVVSHSDEGGVMRDIFRSAHFGVSYGGIYTKGVEDYTGLPVPSAQSPGSFVALVDSILLKCAAVSSISDPLIAKDGDLFPTVITLKKTAPTISGVNSGQIDSGQGFKEKFRVSLDKYSYIFSEYLAKIFSVSCDPDPICRHISACLRHFDDVSNRHVRVGPSIAPFYWIEPTSLVEKSFRSQACKAGFGCVAFTDCNTKYKFFEQAAVLDDCGGQYDLGVKLRSARTSGLLMYLSMHPDNGLGSIIPRQFVSNMVHLARDGGDVASKRNAQEPISDYMWGRGHSALPHPAELMYHGKGFGLRVKRVGYDEDLNLVVEHTPIPDDFLNKYVTFSVSRPEYIGVRKMLHLPSDVSRVRTHAADALENARLRTMRLGKFNEGLAIADFDGNWFGDTDVYLEPKVLTDQPKNEVVAVGARVDVITGQVPLVRHDVGLRPNPRAEDVVIQDRGGGRAENEDFDEQGGPAIAVPPVP